jgi:hypothetical protein
MGELLINWPDWRHGWSAGLSSFSGLGRAVGAWRARSSDGRWGVRRGKDAVPQVQPCLGVGPMHGESQHGSSLRSDQSCGHVDQLAAQGRTSGGCVGTTDQGGCGAQQVVVIAAHSAQAEFAAKRPDGRCASGPSMRSENTVSMIAWPRE